MEQVGGILCSVAAAVTLAACTADPIVITPVVDRPIDDDAEAFHLLDALSVSIAGEGAVLDLKTERFSRGEPIALDNVPFGATLVMHLIGFRGTSPNSYGRTCAFEIGPDTAVVSPHVYFSQGQKFGQTGIVPLDRTAGRAVTYQGSAVFLGGTGSGGSVREVEQFDPRTGELTEIATVRDRADAVDALLGLAPPRIALIGGTVGGFGADFVELIDPDRVESVDDPTMARVGLTATSLTDGRIIVAGGHSPNGMPVGTVTQIGLDESIPEITNVAVLVHPRSGHTATRLGDDDGSFVLIAGGASGLNGTGAMVPDAELYKPFAKTVASPLAPTMRFPRTRHQAARLSDGSVLLIGGIDATGTPVRQLERFTIDAGFVAVVDDDGMQVALDSTLGVVDNTVTELPDGRLLLVGGLADPKNQPTVATTQTVILRFDPEEDGRINFLPTDRLAVARAGHQAAIMCDGTIFVTGGGPGIMAERYNPPADGRR